MIDSLGLGAASVALPGQIATARRAAEQTDLSSLAASRVECVIVAGMGGSGIGGDIAAAIGGRTARVPVVAVKQHELPAFVDRTLVIATSFSGNTAETLDAVAEARARGAQLLLCSAGGRLAALAAEWRTPHVALDAAIPMPRAAIGAVGIVPLVVLARLGLTDPAGDAIDECIAHLEKRIAKLSSSASPAHATARQIGGSFPLVYSAGAIGAVAAYRWKCQINENAKAPAFWSPLPEANHNELAGWGQHGDISRQTITAVYLRHSFEAPRVSEAYAFLDEVHDEVTGGVIEVRAEGSGPLTQLYDLIAYGDFVSLAMAGRAGLDPGPIPALDELKARLG